MIYAGGCWFGDSGVWIRNKNDKRKMKKYFETNWKVTVPEIGKMEIGYAHLIKDIFACLKGGPCTLEDLSNTLEIDEDNVWKGFKYFTTYNWVEEFGILKKKWRLTPKGEFYYSNFSY